MAKRSIRTRRHRDDFQRLVKVPSNIRVARRLSHEAPAAREARRYKPRDKTRAKPACIRVKVKPRGGMPKPKVPVTPGDLARLANACVKREIRQAALLDRASCTTR